MVFFNFAAFSILQKKLQQNSRLFDNHGKIWIARIFMEFLCSCKIGDVKTQKKGITKTVFYEKLGKLGHRLGKKLGSLDSQPTKQVSNFTVEVSNIENRTKFRHR